MKTTTIDFIGIGTPKSGTTTVARLLDMHPDICLSVPKEIKYFNYYNSYWRPERENKDHLKSLKWYLIHFNHCSRNSIKGEFSASYIVDPIAPKIIYNTFPNVKLILCLRNPVDRAYSSYQMVKSYSSEKYETRTFSQVIRNEREYIEKGLYFKHLSRYLNYFDRSQIFILTFEEIKDAPLASIQKLYRFLGVNDAFIPENVFLKANSSKKAYFRFITRLENTFVKTVADWGGGKFIKWLKKGNWIHKLYTKPYDYPPMKEEDQTWLKQQFRSDIEKLEHLLGRNFSHWK